MRQARKVGKRVIGEIEAQIEQLLELRSSLLEITQAKKDEIEKNEAPVSALLEPLDSRQRHVKPSLDLDDLAGDKEI